MEVTTELGTKKTRSLTKPTASPLLPRRYRFLFAVAMFSGNATIFHNLQDAVARMPEIDATWLPIEIEPHEWITKLPPISSNWWLRGGLATKLRIRSLEHAGNRFDAALFHHQVLTLWLRDFRRRVPMLITLDATPSLHDEFARWYVKKTGPKTALFQRIKRAPVRRIFRDAVYILPFSHWVKQSLINDYGVAEEKICVTPPGLDLDLWNKGKERNAGKKLNVSPRILFVGGDFMRKGGDLVARVAGRAEFSGCEFHFVTRSFCGETLKNVFIHENLQPNDEGLRDLYRHSDIFVLPTRADFHSLASLEAMAMGLPVITTRVGGVSEILEEGENGYFMPVDDEETLVDRLRRLVRNKHLRETMGTHGRRTVEERFNVKNNVSYTIELMKRAADDHRLHSSSGR